MWRSISSIRAFSLLASIALLNLLPSRGAAESYDPPGGDTIPERIRPFAQFIADVGDRSRRVIYSAYPVSAQRGVIRGFVHVTDGSAVLARTDIVVDAAMPIVVRRAYHSHRTQSPDFGNSGWRLAISERIERDSESGALQYVHGNGSTLDLGRDGSIRSELAAYLSDVLDVRLLSHSAIRVKTRTGLKKEFGLVRNVYRLMVVTDADGNRLELRYSPQGALRRVENSEGQWIAIERDQRGRIIAVRDSSQRTVRYAYDQAGRLSEMLDAGEHTWGYRYDTSNRLVSTTTPNDYVDVEFQYDGLGRVAMSRAHGVRTEFRYPGPTTTIATDKLGLVTTYLAAASGLTTRIINPLGIDTSLQLSRAGLPLSLTRNDVRIVDFAPHPRDRARMTKATLLDTKSGQSYVTTYDASGRVIAVDSAVGGYRVEEYGSRLVGQSIVYTDGSKQEIRFDRRGELRRLEKADGSVLTFAREGERWSIGDGAQRKVELRFNSRGQLSAATTPEGYELAFTYNDLGLREATDTSYGAVVRYQYDASGSLFHSASGLASMDQVPAHTYLFGIDHRIDEVRGSGGDLHQYVYGEAGELRALRSSVLSRDVSFAYDELGRLARVEYEGKTVKHYYAPGEADIVARAGVRTLPVFNQQREISEFPSRFEAGLTRIRPASMGLLTYDEVKHELAIAADPVSWTPAASIVRSISALRVESLLKDRVAGLQSFTIPSNRLFVPREYESVNCCVCMCGGFPCLPE